MKIFRNSLLVSTALILMLMGDASGKAAFGFQLMNAAHAVFGVWRRTARRTAVVTSAAVATTAAANQAATSETAAAQQQQTANQQQASEPPAPVADGKPLPLGTVVSRLPGGCSSTPVGGVYYYYCDGNFYRAVFQGNSLVYVTAKP